MGRQVADISSWRNCSLNKIAQMAGIARETVQTRLIASSVKPADMRDGFPVYDIWEAAVAILAPKVTLDYSDPEKLPPKERRDWYAGTLDKRRIEKEEGKLLDYSETKQIMAEIIKPALQMLDSIPDNLERDYNIPPKAISEIEEKFNQLREHWANELEKL
jgi:hypothetical protein